MYSTTSNFWRILSLFFFKEENKCHKIIDQLYGVQIWFCVMGYGFGVRCKVYGVWRMVYVAYSSVQITQLRYKTSSSPLFHFINWSLPDEFFIWVS